MAFTAVGTEREEDQTARSAQREQQTEAGRDGRKIIDKKRKKYRDKNGSLRAYQSVVLKNHTSVPIRKYGLSSSNNARREATRNNFMKEGGMPGRVESHKKVNRSKNRLKARSGFVKPVRNGLRKKQNLIEIRPTRA